MTVTWAGANARRLARQHLHPDAAATASPFAAPGDAVAAMLGAHAQVLSAAELSVGLRGDGLTPHGRPYGAVDRPDTSAARAAGPR